MMFLTVREEQILSQCSPTLRPRSMQSAQKCSVGGWCKCSDRNRLTLSSLPQAAVPVSPKKFVPTQRNPAPLSSSWKCHNVSQRSCSNNTPAQLHPAYSALSTLQAVRNKVSFY